MHVQIEGGPEAIGTRWQAEGDVEGDGRTVLWRPSDPDDRLRVAVRTEGGVAVVSLGVPERA
ncbi:MAG: hypothetical protein DRJ42_21710 [Deltaproteobacteria bacterium]|nr:MAG: hypothetical protein DRJ42_21710 [Deltaproteobacteria bacterium]